LGMQSPPLRRQNTHLMIPQQRRNVRRRLEDSFEEPPGNQLACSQYELIDD